METKTISSAGTFFFKFILPALAITAFGAGTLATWCGPRGPEPEGLKWLFLAAWIIGSTAVLWQLGPIKKVRIAGQNLYISNFIQEISIPVTAIAKIKQSFWSKEHPITLYLHEDTIFGRKIRFMPKRRFMSLQFPYPIVAELKKLAGITPSNTP